jgi:signal transduction histidine kinase/CheY-like chemotaxis protein
MLLGFGDSLGDVAWAGMAIGAAVIAVLATILVRQRKAAKRLRRELAVVRAQARDARSTLEQSRRRARELAVMAHGAKALRNEFLSNISHEVRTPMNTIVGMTELSLTTPLTPKQRHYLEEVRDASNSLLGLLNDLLDLAKIHDRRLELNPAPFRLTECLTDVISKFRTRAIQKGLRLDFHIDPDVPNALIGDPGRLRQVMAALVSNAIKFTEKGKISVRVEPESVQDGEIHLHLSVQDTGIGIAPEKHTVIFEAFRQADGSETRAYVGLGVGLTIAFELVNMMGGRMWLESEPGKGSIFHFTVRFRLQTEAAARKAVDDFSGIRGQEVLLVHEDRAVRHALEELVLSLHMKPVTADSSDAAISALILARDAGRPAPVVILGDAIPPEGGFDLAAQIMADPALQRTHVLLVALAGKRGDAARSRRLGLSAYLTFPVTRSELGNAVLAAVEHGWPKSGAPFITKHWLREHRPAV